MARKSLNRADIVKAALKLFLEKGVSDTKVIDIAHEAGIQHSLVLYHFKTMPDLYLAVLLLILEDTKNKTMEIKEAPKDFWNKLQDYIALPYAKGKEDKGYLRLWMYFYYEASRDERFRKVITELRKESRDRMKLILSEGISTQALALSVLDSLNDLTMMMQSYTTGQFIIAFSNDDIDLDKAANDTFQFIKAILQTYK